MLNPINQKFLVHIANYILILGIDTSKIIFSIFMSLQLFCHTYSDYSHRKCLKENMWYSNLLIYH